MIITIDGVAGSGKSSTAREVARKLGFLHLDSGALYRALAHAALRMGGATVDSPLEPEAIRSAVEADIGVEVGEEGMVVNLAGHPLDAELRTPEVTALASRIAVHAPVRDRVNGLLRDAASRHPRGVVCEGRDMGTVVFPDADLKVYMTATPEERARRRLRQQGQPVTGDAIRSEVERLKARDRADTERALSPLRRPPDAVVLDTTDRALEDQVERIVSVARERLTR